MRKQYLLLSLFVLAIQFAQAQFTLDGEFRPRAEFRNGFGSLIAEDVDAAFGISTRARLNAGYKTDAYKFYLSLQDVLVWGDQRQIQPWDYNNSFAVFEAWAELKLAPGFSTKLGRQVLSYDDQRILGGLGWAQQARNHDAALFRYKTDNNLKLDIALAFNQDTAHPTGFDSTGTAYVINGFFTYKAMQMLHLNKKWDKVGLSVLVMNNTFQDLTTTSTTSYIDANGDGVIDPLTETDAYEVTETTSSAGTTSDLQTFGTHLTFKDAGFNAALNAYYQMGQRQNSVDVGGAYLLGLDLGYKVSDKLTLGIGGELISGNDDDPDDTTAFFPLYGTNHKFNGFMDYFYVGNHANSVGLIDIHAMAKIKTGPKSGLMIKALNFMGEQDLGLDSNQLGTEVDLVFTQKFKGYTMKLGYSQMFATEGMEALKGLTADGLTPKGVQNWAWAMLIIKPKFFGGAKKPAPKMKK